MLKLHNTLDNLKVEFIPIDHKHIKLYACGPTVYSFPHIGNARSVIVYDLLFRILRHLYEKVTYVRNITDVDDKIINAAKTEGKDISTITTYYTEIFQKNMSALGCLSPTFEPKATDHINDIIVFIEKLIARNHAYVIDGYVYFDISSYEKYGHLSGRKTEDLIAGSRVTIDNNKRNPGDFILWKPTTEYGWDSPWSYGRPGWHIECSVMSNKHLGSNFDIHGGGADLQFPHHENEIAQSCCAHPGSTFANYWVHNGFVLVDSEKMSKSIGNVLTVKDLLADKVQGSIIRYVLLSTHYKKPLNWTDNLLCDAKVIMNKFLAIVQEQGGQFSTDSSPHIEVIDALCDDLNTPQAIAVLHKHVKEIKKGNVGLVPSFIANLKFLGLIDDNYSKQDSDIDNNSIEELIQKRAIAKAKKDFDSADLIRNQLLAQGIELYDLPDGITHWQQIED